MKKKESRMLTKKEEREMRERVEKKVQKNIKERRKELNQMSKRTLISRIVSLEREFTYMY